MTFNILKTGHQIADTVAQALEEGLYGKCNGSVLFHAEATAKKIGIGYGILRGMSEVFKSADQYVHLDRGYFKPHHFDGYYRVSLNGTQQTTGLDKLEPDYDRLNALKLDIKPWRGFDRSKPVLVCFPTDAVREFFGIKRWEFIGDDRNAVYRHKGDTSPINFHDYNYVITFNTSVGWQALQNGIPCISDPTHSIVGKWYHNISLDNLEEAQYIDRNKLFATMAGLQLSLEEIRAGKIWELVSKLLSLYTSSSGMIPESQSPLMSQPTAS